MASGSSIPSLVAGGGQSGSSDETGTIRGEPDEGGGEPIDPLPDNSEPEPGPSLDPEIPSPPSPIRLSGAGFLMLVVLSGLGLARLRPQG